MLLLSLLMREIDRLEVHPPEALQAVRGSATNPLLDAYPTLSRRIPWQPLAALPTPTQKVPVQDGDPLLVKRDDLTSPLYGGNKVRKLEFLLADASLSLRKTLITLGGTGSNHALATALHGREHGFDVDLVLYDQPTGPLVKRNLGGFLAAGARLHHAGTTVRAFAMARRLHFDRRREGAAPYFINVGGTSCLGCLGYVSAAFELRSQIEQGEAIEPATIFVPLGTTGTAAGLIAGLRLAGLRSRVVAVRVADPVAANRRVLTHFAREVVRFLRRIDPSLPNIQIRPEDFDVLTDQYGRGYGYPTPAAEDALERVKTTLSLDTTYSAKALAACFAHRRDRRNTGPVLFWNTFSSSQPPRPGSWVDLPDSLRHLAPPPYPGIHSRH